eukprot:1069997-Prorocentrum_minimum.AAC.1
MARARGAYSRGESQWREGKKGHSPGRIKGSGPPQPREGLPHRLRLLLQNHRSTGEFTAPTGEFTTLTGELPP